MSHDQQPGRLQRIPHTDNNVLLATVLAILLAAGSALVLRARRRTMIRSPSCPSPMPGRASPKLDASIGDNCTAALSSPDNGFDSRVKVVEEAGDDSTDTKKSRSKERRRRGKDPYKEILKGGKKNKLISKSGKPSTAATDQRRTASSPATANQVIEPEASQDSHDSSIATSSPSSTSTDLKPVDITESASILISCSNQPTPTLIESQKMQRDNALPPDSSGSADSSTSVRPQLPTRLSRPVFGIVNDDDGKEASSSALETPDASQSPSTSLSGSISSAFGSGLSPNHSSCSFEINDPVHIHSSQSMPPYFPTFHSTAIPPSAKLRATMAPVQKYNSTWDWDGQNSPNHETTYQKPPRFRSKSRVSSSGSISGLSASIPYNMSFTSTTSYSPVTPPSLLSDCLPSSPPASVTSHMTQNVDPSHPFTYPTLNPPSPTPSPSPYPNGYLHMNTTGTSATHNSRRTTGPHRMSTPATGAGGSTPPPSVSTHTQIASLKGALEAARMREEKSRHDAEQYAKESEMLRWRWSEDIVAWRRKEAELQTQIQLLMQQLQVYAAAFVNIPSPSPSSSSRLQVPNVNRPYLSHQISPLSAQPQQPLSPPTQISPNSQTALKPRPPSPFLAYPTQSPSHPQSNLLSLLFPSASSPNPGSGLQAAGPSPVSVSGSSSVGSLSPQLDAPPIRDRGRRRTRIKSGDGDWVVDEDDDGVDELDGDEVVESNNDVSDALADAILKHPESMRARSKVPREQKPQAEFTFPSISNIGNVEKNDKNVGLRAGDATFRSSGSSTDVPASEENHPAE